MVRPEGENTNERHHGKPAIADRAFPDRPERWRGGRAGAANPAAGNGPCGTAPEPGGGGVATGNGPIGGMGGGPNGDVTQGAPKANPPLMGNESRGS